jgi:hypothetical protein
LDRIFDYAQETKGQDKPVTGIGFWFQLVVAVLTVVASSVSALAEKIEKLTSRLGRDGWLGKAGHYSMRGLIYIASAAVPLLIWGVYILLSFWGIRSKIFCADQATCQSSFAAPVGLIEFSQSMFGSTAAGASFSGVWAGLASGKLAWVASGLHWLDQQLFVVTHFFSSIFGLIMAVSTWAANMTTVIGGTYVLVAIILFVISLLPTLNANSLHRLYRDRLSTAFIFYERLPERPAAPATPGPGRRNWAQRLMAASPPSEPTARAKTSDFIVALDHLKLSLLSGLLAPYHIINTALNIQGSKYANQRGRNAEFFMFTRNFVGSEATGYIATPQMESVARDLNVATAMAISGAAASSNMGSSTIRPLTPSLSILNVRLGYWLRNPNAAVGVKPNRVAAWLAELANLYFFKEMFGRLDENTYNVYLTDGGHVENLGIYELLKRRCRLIIAVDAEADPKMNFGSYIKLQRHARIDLGTRIELPWQAIRNGALETSQMIAGGGKAIPDTNRCGPHAALGIIRYPKGEIGYLLYVKASLSGDENDYIIDYQRRNPTFPHESTGDQLFTEEQFEVYRALGFHAMHRIFTGEDKVSAQANDGSPPRLVEWTSTAIMHNPMPDVRSVLGV